ncbi:hypothetical protein Tco_0302768 [Tanacetum coccineum]
MAAPGGNQLARRVVDDLIEFSGQTSVDGYMNFFKAQQISESCRFVNRMREEVQTCRNQIVQLNALIAEIEAFDDPGEVFDTLMGLRDDVRVEQAKLMGLNELVTQVEEEIEMKEAQLEVADGTGCVLHRWEFGKGDIENGDSLKVPNYSYLYLSEVVESPRLVDKMKYVFSRSRGEDESFAGLMRDLCLSLRVSLSKKRRLVAELEAVGEVEGAVKCLEHMRVIVARDAVTLGELETLLGRAQVGVSLKAGFVADMDVKD